MIHDPEWLQRVHADLDAPPERIRAQPARTASPARALPVGRVRELRADGLLAGRSRPRRPVLVKAKPRAVARSAARFAWLAGVRGALRTPPASALVAALALASACAAPDAQRGGEVPWPDEAWSVSTPAAEGFDEDSIDALVADVDAGRYGLVDHFLIVRNGRLVVDRSWDRGEDYARIAGGRGDAGGHPYDYDDPDWHPHYRGTRLHTLQSVTKSVTSVAFGIAVDAGRVDVEAPAWPFLAAYGPDMSEPNRAAATVEDFLTMRSGIDWAAPGQTYDDPAHPTVELEASSEWIDYVARRPVGTEPGTRFDYNDGVSVLLGKILREATGRRADAWAEERLFRPIGIREHRWKITPDGEADTEGGLYLAPRDLARVAYLMLREGEWRGRRIVSRRWVRASTSPVVPDLGAGPGGDAAGYGYQWWVPAHENGETRVYSGNGYGGQFLHVVPERDLIVLFNGWTLHRRPELSAWTALWDRILPALRN